MKNASITREQERAYMRSFRDRDCECCGINDGTVVGAHCNEFGGGMGYRARGIIAALCADCHAVADGRKGTAEEKRIVWKRVLHNVLRERAEEFVEKMKGPRPN